MENVYPITLGPHGCELEEVLVKLEYASKSLERGVLMDINLTGGSNARPRINLQHEDER